MHRLAIGEDHYAEPASSGFLYSGPATYATIRLCALVLGLRDYPSNPGFAYTDAVAATSNIVEVLRCLHSFEGTTRRFPRG